MFDKISPFGRNDKKGNYVIADLIRNPDALSFVLAPFVKGATGDFQVSGRCHSEPFGLLRVGSVRNLKDHSLGSGRRFLAMLEMTRRYFSKFYERMDKWEAIPKAKAFLKD